MMIIIMIMITTINDFLQIVSRNTCVKFITFGPPDKKNRSEQTNKQTNVKTHRRTENAKIISFRIQCVCVWGGGGVFG